MNENSEKNVINEEVKEKPTIVRTLAEWGKSLVIALLISFLILRFVLFIAVVPTDSMVPTIHEGERIVICRFLRYFDWEHRGLNYGDIVVFDFSQVTQGEDTRLLVKRVIGMGGDRISIDNGIVYRNGERIEEPYVKNKDSFFMDEFIVPENEIFVMGDNRINSFDSRYWETKGYNKTVPLDSVVGEVPFLF